MKKIKLFYLENCPYCHYAKRAVKELCAEDAAYAAIKIEWIEESRCPAIAEQYDYYYVPTVFFDGNKLYEAHPSEDYASCKANLKRAFDTVLS